MKILYEKIQECPNFARNVGLDVHAGHGLTYKSVKVVSSINSITEYNIGHFIISESIFTGLSYSVKKFKKIINS